jgi:hypothetical protein
MKNSRVIGWVIFAVVIIALNVLSYAFDWGYRFY